MNPYDFMRKLIKKPLFIVLVFVAAAAASAYFVLFKETVSPYDFVPAKKGSIVQEVSVTGTVEPADNVDLAFEKTGRVFNVYVDVGDEVKAGDLLVRLESSELSSDLAQAEASLQNSKAQMGQYEAALQIQEAKLLELKIGTRQEEIEIYAAKLENTEVSLSEAKKNLIDKLKDAYTKSDDAVRNKIDQFFSNPRGASPQVNFTIGDSQLRVSVENGRVEIENVLTFWQESLGGLTVLSGLDAYINEANNNLDKIKYFLDKVSLAVNGLASSSILSQTTIDSWRADVSTARTNVYTAISNLSAAAEKFRTAEAALLISENELALKKAGSTQEQIAAQQAQVSQARANVSAADASVSQAEAKVQSAMAQLAKNNLISPLNGIVTKQEAKVGQIVSANSIIISVISKANFQIEANIAESDIAKVKIGDEASLTLDAYGDENVFTAHVVKINPAETVIEGISTYKTTLQFDSNDSRIRSGLTANLDILTDSREDVLVVPQRAVISKDGIKIIRVLKDDGAVTEKEVKTGLRGSSGMIEITGGLNEGENVVIFVKE